VKASRWKNRPKVEIENIATDSGQQRFWPDIKGSRFRMAALIFGNENEGLFIHRGNNGVIDDRRAMSKRPSIRR
jgi:hypothetical protein